MLTRHQRKKFPKLNSAPLKDFTEKVMCLIFQFSKLGSLDVVVLILILLQAKRNFIILCLIVRLSVILQRSENLDLQEVEFLESAQSFKLVSNSSSFIILFLTTHCFRDMDFLVN